VSSGVERMETDIVRPAQDHLPEDSFQGTIQRLSQQDIRRCYFCQKCSAGCPTAYAMDYPPAQLLKMVQLGMKEDILKSSAIWLCVGCETCGTRCPNGIAVSPVMDVLKKLALDEGYVPPERNSLAFHRSFVDSIRFLGRVHEMTMLAEYKLRSLDLLSDLGLGLQMFRRNKLALIPRRVRRQGQVRDVLAHFESSPARADWHPEPVEGRDVGSSEEP
jgi:heterodisulfide reductase subunit C